MTDYEKVIAIKSIPTPYPPSNAGETLKQMRAIIEAKGEAKPKRVKLVENGNGHPENGD